ncbi:MAG: DUF3644 domain-containing protein [bacterium]
MHRRLFSEKVDLILKSREAALSAVQIYNNPLTTFKTESFIVLFIIAWTYLLHAYYRSKKIDYRYYTIPKERKKFLRNPDGSIKHWDIKECISKSECPLDKNTSNNLKFLIGLRNQIEHKKATGLDSYLSARYQACALNYNYYLKELFGTKYSLDNNLALSLQFAELDYTQANIIKDKEGLIPKEIHSYIADFDNSLTDDEIKSDRFAYRLLFSKVVAKRQGQADRVIEFIDPESPLAKNISKEYWIKEDREKPKFLRKDVLKKVQAEGHNEFGPSQHTQFWKDHNGKNPAKGFGVEVCGTWYWYQKWIDFILKELQGN